MNAWDRSYAFVLAREGGFSNNPLDAGGPTYRGISVRAAVALDHDKDGHLDFDLDRDGDVDVVDMRELERLERSGDPTAADLISNAYRTHWWFPVRAGEMPWPWPLLMFDGSVNHGPRAAVLMLQRALATVKADGIIGAATMRAVIDEGTHEQRSTIVQHRYLVERSKLYARLSYRDARRLAIQEGRTVEDRLAAVGLDGTFYRGWMTRLFQLQSACLAPLP